MPHDPVSGHYLYPETPDPLPLLTDAELAWIIRADRPARVCAVCGRPYDTPVDAYAARTIGSYCSLTCTLGDEPVLRDADVLPEIARLTRAVLHDFAAMLPTGGGR